jgi:Na+-translocating ferredoxin:NAD+ oxidoreductase RnfA subunit
MNLTNFLFQAHSGWRHLVIAVLVLVLVKLLFGLVAKQRWSRLDHALGVTTPLVITVQWLLGIVLWSLAPTAWFLNRGSVNFWEHSVTMTLAVAAAHMGWSRAKRTSDDAGKYRVAFIGFLIAGLLVAVGVARITGWM